MSGYNNKYNDGYKAQTVENVSSNQPYSPPKQNKMKQHLRKYWWLHLISFIVGVILITLLLVFVGMPNIAQNGINDAQLTLQSQTVTNPTPSSVQIQMVTVSRSKSSFHPWLDEFQAALFLQNTEPNIKPFGYITIPRVKADAVSTITVNQPLEIADQVQFAAYTKLVMMNKEYSVAIRGRTGLKEGSFPKTTINFNKVVTSPGLNALQGFKVMNITISIAPDLEGNNMHGIVYIPNPSPLTIQMGTVSQNVFVDGVQIAVATIPNLTLNPGDNYVPMQSASNQSAVIDLIMHKYPTANIPVTIIGNSSVFNGQHLTYYEEALKANVLSTNLTLGPALQAAGLGALLPPAPRA